jgi:hypothetical protein
LLILELHNNYPLTQFSLIMIQICVLDSTDDEDCDGQVDEERCTLISYNFRKLS